MFLLILHQGISPVLLRLCYKYIQKNRDANYILIKLKHRFFSIQFYSAIFARDFEIFHELKQLT